MVDHSVISLKRNRYAGARYSMLPNSEHLHYYCIDFDVHNENNFVSQLLLDKSLEG